MIKTCNVQTVEDASSRAAAATFGTAYVRPSAKPLAHNPAVGLQFHDAAYSEGDIMILHVFSSMLAFSIIIIFIIIIIVIMAQ